MPQLNVAAAGNKDTGVNLINARFQAEALRRIRGKDCGVLDNSFYSTADTTGLDRASNDSFKWPLSATDVQNITVGRGMATAYGYDLQSESPVSFIATAPSAGTKYLFIYLEWDLSNPVEAVGSIKMQDNGGGVNWTPPSQDNLITNPIGKYQMPLYRIAVNTAGSVTGTASLFTTIGNPLRADYATRANDSDRADYASGNNSATINNRLNALSSRLDLLGFKSGNITNASGGVVGTLKRQGNYVIGTITDMVFPASGSVTYYVPVYFRPAADTYLLTIGCYNTGCAFLSVKPDGTMVCSGGNWVNKLEPIYVWGGSAPTRIGYEVPPIT